jgi:hypothetical protein
VLAVGPHKLRSLSGADRAFKAGETVGVRVAPEAVRVLGR